MLTQEYPGSSGAKPVTLFYQADLLGNIQQALAGLQGFGVMALELIQNADDAGAATVVFDVTAAALAVYNSAAFSTCGLEAVRCPWEETGDPNGVHRSCNFHALSRMGSRNKVHVTSQIGRFGIGFVSVYQITDTPIIRSTGIEMRLDPVTGTGATRVIPYRAGTQLELPWASTPSITRRALNASPTPADVASLVRDAISSVMARGLFFLHNLSQIELLENGKPVGSVSIDREEKLVTLRIEPEQRTESWLLLAREASDLAQERDIFSRFPTLADLDRSPTVTVAFPLHEDAEEGLLYAFLPTEQKSGLPVHINADFFPHPTRRMITLTGEQHERYWNELLLDTAAKIIAQNFDQLRDVLGAERLWALAAATFAIKDVGSFQSFWADLEVVAKSSKAVLSVKDEWCEPAGCYFPRDLEASARTALASVGVTLLHEGLRPYSTVLSALGVAPLNLAATVAALEVAQNSGGFEMEASRLRSLWTAIDTVVAQSTARQDFKPLIERLKAVTFLCDMDGKFASLNELWQPQVSVPAELIRTYLPVCCIAHDEVCKLPAITKMIRVYGLDNLAEDLAAVLKDVEAANATIGNDPGDAATFYGLLTAFEFDPKTTRIGKILSETPLLKAGSGFVSPSRAQLPGNFVDPIGHFELIDTAEMSDRMQRFARDALSVKVLTFPDYVNLHLEDILASELSREKYMALLLEILAHKTELGDERGLQNLGGKVFVRTRAGTYARPGDCYYWTAPLEGLLGDDQAYWVDEEWMPQHPASSRFRDLLEGRLGMGTTASIDHLVGRIEAIATGPNSIDTIATGTQPIVRHIIDRFARLEPDERRTLEKLRTVSWLPGAINGARISDKRYQPSLLYRSFRAAGYDSQVAVVDLPILRLTLAGRSLTDFLDFLEMPDEPSTEVVVAHLRHCMAENLPASDVNYAILYERLEKHAAIIDGLAGTAFIYDADTKSYLRADHVFWGATQFRGYWRTASLRMYTREALYRRLGVRDVPSACDYAALLQEIAEKPLISPGDAEVHERCLAWLVEALDKEDAEARQALQELRGKSVLLNLRNVIVQPDDVVWLDSQVLRESFEGALDDRLVMPPLGSRHAAGRLFAELQVMRFSEIARLRLSSTPISQADISATSRLRERTELLLWLAPRSDFRAKLREILDRAVVQVADALYLHAELGQYEPPVQSPSRPADAFFEPGEAILYVRGTVGNIDWSAAFSALFAPLERFTHGIDMSPVIMTAAYVMVLGTSSDAERALLNANYQRPEQAYDELPLTDTVADPTDADPEDGVQLDEKANENQPEIVADGSSAAHLSKLPPQTDSGDDSRLNVQSIGSSSHGGSLSGQTLGATNMAGAATSIPHGSTGGEPFTSRIDDGGFGAGSGNTHHEGKVAAPTVTPDNGTWGTSRGWGNSWRPGSVATEWPMRRTRMLTYVSAASNPANDHSGGNGSDDVNKIVDRAAIKAVLQYEARLGRNAVEQPHNNPGFDIISSLPDGAGRRLIEVKGLDGDWTERGVKLSQAQFTMAQRHPQEYWIYVVENANDLQNLRVTAVSNPFAKVAEYWFDNGWKGVAEETARDTESRVRVGGRLQHPSLGVGTIEQVTKRGMAISLLVEFTDGRKLIPFSSTLEFMD